MNDKPKPVKNKQKLYVKPEAIMNYLLGEEKLKTLFTAQSSLIELVTSDQNLYEALGSIQDRSKIDINLLVKFLEVTKIVPHFDLMKTKRKILTPDRVDELNKRIIEK
jgi:hypothetical protein